jgi:hypothetical protein
VSAAAAAVDQARLATNPKPREHDYQRLQRIQRDLVLAGAPCAAQLVMMALLGFLNPIRDFEVWPGIAKIEELTGLKRRSIHYAVGWLETHQFLHRTIRGGQPGVKRSSTHYWLDVAQLPANVCPFPAPEAQDRPARPIKPVHVAAPVPVHVAAPERLNRNVLPDLTPPPPLPTAQQQGGDDGETERRVPPPGLGDTDVEELAEELCKAFYRDGLEADVGELTRALRRRELAIARQLVEVGVGPTEAAEWAQDTLRWDGRIAAIDLRSFERERIGWRKRRSQSASSRYIDVTGEGLAS